MMIPKHVKKYIEGELFNYPRNRIMLDYEKQNVYAKNSPNSYGQLTQGKYFMSDVEQKAVDLLSEQNINCLNKSVSAIEDVLEILPEEYKQLIEMRYFKAYNTERVAGELNICIRNFFYWRDKAIKLLAVRFGLI